MCTVSFIPVKNNFFITTNRDEKNSRRAALPPAEYFINNQKLFFPKDGDAGGTWIVMKENGDAAVLLNGAFISHEQNPPYRQSRGIILLELFSANSPANTLKKINLQNIEPFTIILFESRKLYEFRWDGLQKYFKLLELKQHTWASCTLYDAGAKKIKEGLFTSFLSGTPVPNAENIFHFHRKADFKKFQQDYLQVDEEVYSTVSITGILTGNDGCTMYYYDMKTETDFKLTAEMPQSFLQLNEKNF